MYCPDFFSSYYFFRSINARVPAGMAKFITSLQILQFSISLALLADLGFKLDKVYASISNDIQIIIFAYSCYIHYRFPFSIIKLWKYWSNFAYSLFFDHLAVITATFTKIFYSKSILNNIFTKMHIKTINL